MFNSGLRPLLKGEGMTCIKTNLYQVFSKGKQMCLSLSLVCVCVCMCVTYKWLTNSILNPCNSQLNKIKKHLSQSKWHNAIKKITQWTTLDRHSVNESSHGANTPLEWAWYVHHEALKHRSMLCLPTGWLLNDVLCMPSPSENEIAFMPEFSLIHATNKYLTL